jgi:signal transduction histidine kinase
LALAADAERLLDQVNRSQRVLKAVLACSANPILIVDRSGRLLLCNQAARKLFDIPDDLAAVPSLGELTGVPRLVELVAAEQMVTKEISHQDRTYLTSVVPIPGFGSVIEMHDTMFIEGIDATKAEFASALSRDLRSPLASVIGSIELLDASGPLTARQQANIALATEAASRMRRLIDNLVDLA